MSPHRTRGFLRTTLLLALGASPLIVGVASATETLHAPVEPRSGDAGRVDAVRADVPVDRPVVLPVPADVPVLDGAAGPAPMPGIYEGEPRTPMARDRIAPALPGVPGVADSGIRVPDVADLPAAPAVPALPGLPALPAAPAVPGDLGTGLPALGH
ncbi:hypothetical protein [Saccharothrix violaceirubra]|uniref:Uncharacterized protein n=1 Tax=Saccharothrix violaceirubra TaxID=413306 RepID=A0A7W7T1K3_9PSEU|nr:hypothetical protein [Saccharothrix violaceirubra]MBB4964882.1 hypothetical protein [Saccharothrix violaceirubra]